MRWFWWQFVGKMFLCVLGEDCLLWAWRVVSLGSSVVMCFIFFSSTFLLLLLWDDGKTAKALGVYFLFGELKKLVVSIVQFANEKKQEEFRCLFFLSKEEEFLTQENTKPWEFFFQVIIFTALRRRRWRQAFSKKKTICHKKKMLFF